MQQYFIGIDIGTQGARAVLISSGGELIIEKGKEFVLNEETREEQSPSEWWETSFLILKELIEEMREHVDVKNVLAVAVTSTSGTVIPLDKNNLPLHNALMYSDKRAGEVASECESAAIAHFGSQPAYTHFSASSGLCKMVWFVRHFPQKAKRIRRWVHAADYITAKLCGNFGISDETNALKSGYDIFSRSWPEYIYKQLPLKRDWLPQVVETGKPIGTLSDELSQKLGLNTGIAVVAGMTDGCASQVASGAVSVGDWNTTIGTTMVIKGVTEKPILDPQGRLYNHRHPQGYFMPGGAGNTGADWVTLDFKSDLEVLNRYAGKMIPSGYISWPLRTEGERFPIIAPQARGFEPDGLTQPEQFVANMEGVAYLEKQAYDLIESLSGEKVKAVYTAGGGSNSGIWLKIRSNVMNLPIYKMKYVSGAVGAAVLAASKTYFNSLMEAAKAMTQTEKVVRPEKQLVKQYKPPYDQFVEKLKEKGYLK